MPTHVEAPIPRSHRQALASSLRAALDGHTFSTQTTVTGLANEMQSFKDDFMDWLDRWFTNADDPEFAPPPQSVE